MESPNLATRWVFTADQPEQLQLREFFHEARELSAVTQLLCNLVETSLLERNGDGAALLF